MINQNDDETSTFETMTNVWMISVNEQGFELGMREYFKKIHSPKIRILPKILYDKLDLVQKLLISEKMYKKNY